ncbi:nucleotide-diphospho-sugar transferase-domain-containing protein [Leucosporidium creatinivorum]|uniref:Nucleotide-diphospho-sugar transferase-domain-containing protein n=1 Tax=Leucosporidium creatinivorum TaxID=106004 RepID=A0A1Y2FD88_9BASI|nr:nucleotide-diphospho-sugar transferase-domain-containing protein [Leucosporidium creatinivorum]
MSPSYSLSRLRLPYLLAASATIVLSFIYLASPSTNCLTVSETNLTTFTSLQSTPSVPLAGTDFRKQVDPALSASLTPKLKDVASPAGNVMLAFATGNYLAVTRNFVHYVRTAGITNFLLVAMDQAAVDYAKEEGIPYYAYIDEEVAKLGGSDSYHSDGFRRVVNRRCKIISTSLRAGFHILQSDLDVVWLKNPFPFFFNGNYDYEIQSDGRTGFSEHDPAAPFREFVNSGIFYARGIPKMADFYDLLIDKVSKNPDRREQHLLNTIVEENLLGVRYRILNPLLYPNGFQYFSRDISNRAGVQPFCIHNNWVDGKHTKEYRFRELGMWTQDPPEYFDKEKTKYLVYYEPSVAHNGWNDVRGSLRSALALAKILDRTLILPKFYSHHGKDVVVTLDYFIDYDAFSAAFPNFREHSFLERMFPVPPKHIFHIDIGPSSLGPIPTEIPQVTFKAAGGFRGATDEEIKRWFAPYQDETILHLTSTFRRFHKFVDPAEDKAFGELLLKGLAPAPNIHNTASFVIKKLKEVAELKTGKPGYNCAHIRRGDFPSVHKGEKTVAEVAELLAEMMPTDEVIYIASDESGSYEFRKTFRERFPQAHFWDEYNRPWFEHLVDPELGESMRLGAIEQQVCKWGQKFVGNTRSSFTSHICYLRVSLGKTGDYVCRDIYGRSWPSDWAYY